jgi:hypothetical protein
LVALYAIVGFFVLPPIVQKQLQQRGSAELGRAVTVQRVRLNPFALSATLENFDIRTQDGSASFLGWRRLYVNLDPLKIVTGDWVVGNVELMGFHAAVEIRPDGSLSFDDLIKKISQAAPKKSDDKPGRPWRVTRLDVSDAQVNFIDRSRREPFQTVVGPTNFTLLDFRTAGGRGAPYRFDATTESGERVNWTGTLNSNPLASKGEWRVEGISLPKYAPYFEDRINASLTSGKLTTSGQYDVNFATDQRRLLVTDALVQLSKLKLVDRKNSGALIELESLDVSGISADGVKNQASVKKVQLTGGRINAERAADGTINLLTAIPPQTEQPGAPSNAAPAPASQRNARPIALTVDEISASDFALSVRDNSTPRPVNLEISQLAATARNFSLAPDVAMPLDVSFRIQPQAAVKIAGSVTIQPLRADLNLDLSDLDVPAFSPYLETMVNARVKRGSAGVKGHAVVAINNDALDANFTGGARLSGFGLARDEAGEDLAGVSEVSLEQIKVATVPRLTIQVGEARIVEPFGRVVMDEKHQLNVSDLMVAKPNEPKAASHAESAAGLSRGATAPIIMLDHLTVESGHVSFEDRSVQPRVRLEVKDLGVVLRDMSSSDPERGEAEIHGLIDGTAPLKANGRANPLSENPFADLKLSTQPVDLSPVGPYVAKYAGYELAGGRLLVDVQAKLVAQRLDMRNTITLDQFNLGQSTQSPDAVKLPVRLGVALLKDSDGKIVLDVPVQGSIDDPQFQIGPVVGRVFTNLLTKAATSPFSLLGAMFGGGGEELGLQEFLPGETTLTAESRQRVVVVERALTARPALNVDIEGGFDAAADTYALKRSKLEDKIRHRVWDEMHATTPDLPPAEQLLVSNQNRVDMINRMFEEAFPFGDKFSEPAPLPAPKVQPPESKPEHRGFIRRAVDVATFKGFRDRRAKRKAEEEAQHAEQAKVAEQKAAAEKAAATSGENGPPAPPQISLEEMTARLADKMSVSQDDLVKLAEARANRVRELLLEGGKIATERLNVTPIDPQSAGAKGPRVKLNLR